MKYRSGSWGCRYNKIHPGDIVHSEITLGLFGEDYPQGEDARFFRILKVENWIPACPDPVLRVELLFYPKIKPRTVGIGWIDWVWELSLEDLLKYGI